MPTITITQTAATPTGFRANVQFDHGAPYPVTIENPFDDRQEQELRWYYEEWLKFPFTGGVKAAEIAGRIPHYGHALFNQLFAHDNRLFRAYSRALESGGVSQLRFEILGPPDFHALHWETLKDPERPRPFAVECPLLRRNINPPPADLRLQPSPTLNVLLVTARPQGGRDVGYRTIARPLVHATRNARLPVRIDMVRPGTYPALVRHLENSRNQHGDGYYHLIHFDVHGNLLTHDQYQRVADQHHASPHLFKHYGRGELPPFAGHKAFLAFNGAEVGEYDMVADEHISALLQTHQIPLAILNACQSGMQVGAQETSLGSRLMAAGVQMVLAMGYSVTVSAAELLMKHLYQELLAHKPPHQAFRKGRLELYNHQTRRAAYNEQIELADWLLPVVYQNHDVAELPIKPSPQAEAAYYEAQASRYVAPEPLYGFFGRDVDILAIETRLLGHEGADDPSDEPRNLLLVQGMGGAGKTTLLKHLMAWWQTTGLVGQVCYFGYDERAYAVSQIVDSIARQLYGEVGYHREFVFLPEAAKRTKLAQTLRSERHLLVLDNLESITGEALAIQHLLPETEREGLRAWLGQLAGGKSLVLLGSRGREAWLVGHDPRTVYELPGLDPEAASGLAKAIVGRLGGMAAHYPSHPEHSKDFQQLLKLLDGYPLALEVVLANLARQTPAQILAAFTSGAEGLENTPTGDLWADKTASIVRCIEYSHSNLSPAAQALLACLAPFTGVVDLALLEPYTKVLQQQPALADLPFDQWGEVLKQAIDWGLLTPQQIAGRVFLRLQPILPYFLRQRLGVGEQRGGGAEPALSLPKGEQRSAVEAAFRAHYHEVGGALAQLIQSKQAQERQLGQALIGLEYENLHHALKLALGQRQPFWNLYESLQDYLESRQAFQTIIPIGQMVLTAQTDYPATQMQGEIGGDFFKVYGQLGTQNFSLKRYGEAAETYHNALQLLPQLTDIPLPQRKAWEATTYHQLGVVAQEQRAWATAEQHYQQALAIFIEFNDRYSQASTYDQLGAVALAQREWATAEQHYQQALAIKIEFNDRYSQARTYHQLGLLAIAQEKYEEAVAHLLQALAIFGQFNDQHSIGIALHNLARLWRTGQVPTLPARLAPLLGASVEETTALLQQPAE